MLTTLQSLGQANNPWSFTVNTLISGGTYSGRTYDPSFSPFEKLESTNLRTTFIFFTPLIKKETEISNQTTNLIFQVVEKDKERIKNKLRNKDYHLLFYTIASNLKEIPNLYQDYYIKVHLEKDVEIKNSRIQRIDSWAFLYKFIKETLE